jgi:prolyl-tRNA editing enzyme YbaK/EbsC (Cys-tRNA(Pro) deacylase)
VGVRVSETPATAFLKKNAVSYTEHPYDYEDKGGTRVSSEKLGVDEHAVVKTLVMEDEDKKPRGARSPSPSADARRP